MLIFFGRRTKNFEICDYLYNLIHIIQFFKNWLRSSGGRFFDGFTHIFFLRWSWCSLVMILVIFFINAHMLIPTISGIIGTKDEQTCSQWLLLPLATISDTVILELGSNSASSVHFSIYSLKFIIFIKAKLGTGAALAINILDYLLKSFKKYMLVSCNLKT